MRDVIIIYFSGTGNTKFVAEEIAGALRRRGHAVSLISAEDKRALAEQDYDGKLIGIGFPCYALSFPALIARTVAELPLAKAATPAFVFATIGWGAGDSVKQLAARMRARNFWTVGTASFICPNNGWLTLFSPWSVLCRNMRYEPRLTEKAGRFADDVAEALVAFEARPYCVKTAGNPVATLAACLLGAMEGLAMQRYRVDFQRCAGCGLCIRSCPDRNIALDEKQRVVFLNPDSCAHCLRCISDCPQDAIRLGRLVTGRGWYTRGLRDEYRRKAGFGAEPKTD